MIELEALSACAKAMTRAMEPVAVPDATMLSEFLSLLAEDGWQVTRKHPNGPNFATGTFMPLPPLATGFLPDAPAAISGVGNEDPNDPIPF